MKPILFNTEMVRAILNGRKTVTRRVIKQSSNKTFDPFWECYTNDNGKVVLLKAPYSPGDILYVRETFAKCQNAESYVYKADFDGYAAEVFLPRMKWRPSIHMPKDAARIFLRVTDVRLERLQDITVDGINREGVDVEPPPICRKGDPTESERAAFAKLTVQKQDEYISTLARHTYMGWCKYADDLFVAWKNLWDSTIKPADIPFYGWDANPWVRVIEFERCEKPKEET